MFSFTTKRRVSLGLATLSLSVGFAMSTGTAPAAADPKQLSALVGAGSDTTQEVMNAMAGFTYINGYSPINSGATGNYQHLASWDATPAQTASDNCITPVINGPTFTRPNGSTEGRKSLYASSTSAAAGWTGKTYTLESGTVLPVCATAVNIGGTVNFARSSSLKSGTGTDVVFIPFGRDALSFVSYRPGGGSPLTTLTKKNLIDIYSGATRVTVADPDGTGTVTIVPCGIQTGSGTYSSFLSLVQSDATKDGNATAECTAAGNGSRVQESKADQMKAKGDALFATGTYAADTQLVVVMGYSASAYIAQANGVATPAGYNSVQLGGISDNSNDGATGVDLGLPVIAGTPVSPNPTFYADAAFGRDVYNVVRRSNLVNTGTGAALNNAYVSIFADTNTAVNTVDGTANAAVLNDSTTNSSKLCQAGDRIRLFGFAEIKGCGDYTTYQRAWDTGAS